MRSGRRPRAQSDLGPKAMHHARESNRLTQVWEPANPRYTALEAKTKSRVDESSVFPEVEIPAVRCEGKILLLDAVNQLVVIIFALRAADYLSVTIGRQAIVAQHRARIVGILLHIECFR